MTPIPAVSNLSSRLFAKGTRACRTLSMKTLRCAKNFGLGAAAGTFICLPLHYGVYFIYPQLEGLPDQLMDQTPLVENIYNRIVWKEGILSPILEEILFRGLLQNIILKKPLKLVDAKITKCFRIGCASALFAVAHLGNRGSYPDNYIKRQVIVALFMGSFLGMIKESKLGLSGAIGAHIGFNIFGIITTRLMR